MPFVSRCFCLICCIIAGIRIQDLHWKHKNTHAVIEGGWLTAQIAKKAIIWKEWVQHWASDDIPLSLPTCASATFVLLRSSRVSAHLYIYRCANKLFCFLRCNTAFVFLSRECTARFVASQAKYWCNVLVELKLNSRRLRSVRSALSTESLLLSHPRCLEYILMAFSKHISNMCCPICLFWLVKCCVGQ